MCHVMSDSTPLVVRLFEVCGEDTKLVLCDMSLWRDMCEVHGADLGILGHSHNTIVTTHVHTQWRW